MSEPMKKVQLMRISDSELKTIKDVFVDNESLLMTIRNLLFGLEVTEEEKKNVRTFCNQEVRRIIRKFMLPEFEKDIPVGMSTDMWMSSVDGIKSNSPDVLYPIFKSQEKWIVMTETALKLLENPDGEKVSLRVYTGLDPQEMYCQILARNNFVRTVETSLQQIKVWAGQKEETVEQTKNRILKDSSK